jgi:Ca2+-binding EF-hand superfamily protein
MEISGMGPMAINYQKMVEQMLDDKDTNGDGALSIEEISMPDEAFAKIDKNEDGLADKNELKAFFPMAQFDRIATEILNEKDANGDGVLTPNEINMPHEAFEKADTNADGKLDKKELADFAAKQAKHDGKTGKKSGKGKSDDETTESVVEIDTDGDGIVDTEEVTTLNAKGEVVSVTTRPLDGSSGDAAGLFGF